MNNNIRNSIDKIKSLNENEILSDKIEDLFNHIQSFKKKIKVNKPYHIYSDGIETAISNSEITEFYLRYLRTNFKKYVASIPFPFEKLDDNKQRFDKLNNIIHIFEPYEDLSLVKYVCFHLMDVILYDMYFNVKSRRFDIYKELDELVLPDANNINQTKKFGLNFIDRENPFNYITFYTNTNPIILSIRNY